MDRVIVGRRLLVDPVCVVKRRRSAEEFSGKEEDFQQFARKTETFFAEEIKKVRDDAGVDCGSTDGNHNDSDRFSVSGRCA